MSDKSVFGLDEKLSGALSYALGFVSGIFYLVMEKENKFVRFHAMQSTVWFLAAGAVNWVVGIIAGIFRRVLLLGSLLGFVSWALGVAIFISWIFLIYKAYKGEMFKIPILGDAVSNQIEK